MNGLRVIPIDAPQLVAEWGRQRRFYSGLRWWIGVAGLEGLLGRCGCGLLRAIRQLALGRVRLLGVGVLGLALGYGSRMVMQATLTTTIPAPGFLFDVAFSPDGRWLALATAKRTPVVEVASGRERLAVRHGSWRGRGEMGVAFSPDGRWLATAGVWDHAARIWDAATGKQLRTIPHEFVDNPGAGHPKVQAVAFSPDSRWLATGSADCTARIFEVASGQELLRVTNAPGVNDAAFSPDGRWLATSGKTTRVWDAASGKKLLGVGHNLCSRVAFSPDGLRLATTGEDKTTRVWDTASGQEVAAFSHDGRTWDVAFGPDGCWLVVGGGATARVWDTTSGKELLVVHHDEATPAAMPDAPMSVAFSPSVGVLATAGLTGRQLDHVVRVWQLREESTAE
jgi:WD40 repeat protein